MMYLIEIDDASAQLVLNALAELPIRVALPTLSAIETQLREQQAAVGNASQLTRNEARAAAADLPPAK